jgi:tetratricopeptide (TPR) repeat protein
MNFEHKRHYWRGWLFHFFGRPERAFDEYRAAFAHDRQEVQAARHLAFIAAQRRDFELAVSWYGEALRIEPGDANTHFNLGFSLEQMGRPAAAVVAFAEAVRLNPALDRAWYGLGLAHAARGAHGEAVVALDEAARLQPMNALAWYQLGMACHLSGQAGRVAEVLTRLVGFDPKMARQLVRDSGRDDLAARIPELPF